MTDNVFVENLKKFRLAKNMTQEKAAEALGKYEEAEAYFKTAGEIGTYFCDELDCLANLYKKTGEYEKSAACYLKMAETYSSRGFDVEAERMRRYAKDAREEKQEN